MGLSNVSFAEFENNNAFYFTNRNIACRLVYTGHHAWRLQSAVNGAFDDMGAGQILANDFGDETFLDVLPFDAQSTDTGLWTLTADDGSKVIVTENPFTMQFYTPKGQPAQSICNLYAQWGETITVFGTLNPNERTYGTGERFNRLNQRGYEVRIYAKDEWAQWKGNSYCPIPLMLSSRGYGILMNRFEQSVFDLDSRGNNTWDVTILNNAPLDVYFFATDDLKDVLYGYALVTGFAPEPAPWLYGTQVCRYAPDFSTAQGVLDMEKAMADNGFPWDAVIMEGFDTYDPKKFEELKTLSQDLHKRGKHVMLYQASGMLPPNAESAYGMKPEYALRKKDNLSPDLQETASYNPMDNPGGQSHRYLDISNPEAVDWWLTKVWGPLCNEAMVDGAKIDFCELVPENEPLLYADGRTTMGTHHRYPTSYNTIMYKFYQSHRDGGMNLSRGGGIGAQRYPFLWAGDQKREFFFLKTQLRAVLSSGMSGLPFMTYDMAAYKPGSDDENNPDNEVFARGTEFTCFTCNIQTHGSVRRPYDFDEDIKRIYRIYANMHDALRPYLVEIGQEATKTGMPPVRALPLWNRQDEMCLDCEDEYTLGDAFLVAPILTRTDKRDIWLPRGEWKDIYTEKVYRGGQMLKDYPAPLHILPLFVHTASTSVALPSVLNAIKPYIDELKSI